MLRIYAIDHIEEIQAFIETADGVKDVVELKTEFPSTLTGMYVKVEGDNIEFPLPWDGLEPPVVVGDFSFSEDHLAAAILLKLGHYEAVANYADDPLILEKAAAFQSFTSGVNLLQSGKAENESDLVNRFLVSQYLQPEDFQSVVNNYQQLTDKVHGKELKAFLLKHVAVFAIDAREMEFAHQLLQEAMQLVENQKSALFSLRYDWINLEMEDLSVAKINEKLDDLKDLITETMNYYESCGHEIYVANLLIQASEIANISNSYAESLGYINRAVQIFEKEDLPEFLGQAFLRKATLLQTWAQNGNPQFFKPALSTYQEALKYFRKDQYPHVYADIHHNLAVIYAEMPIEENKKGMMAAYSASSFNECLEFYNKQDYPYEYAMVANNYASALMKYPPAKQGDNVESAVYYFNEALFVRTAENYPYERVRTILNYLESCWQADNINEIMEKARYNDMVAKAREVKSLTNDPDLLAQAEEHLEYLKQLSVTLLKS